MNPIDNEKKQELRKKFNIINAKVNKNIVQHNTKSKDNLLKQNYNTNSYDEQNDSYQLITSNSDQSNNTVNIYFDKSSCQSKSFNNLNKISKQERLKRICSMALNLQSQLKSTRVKLLETPTENYLNSVSRTSNNKYLTNRLSNMDINTKEYIKNKIKDSFQNDSKLKCKDINENSSIKEKCNDLINRNYSAFSKQTDLEQTIFDDEEELEKSFRQLLPSESHLKMTKKENDRLNSTIIDQCAYNNYSKLDFQHYIDKLKKSADNSRLNFEDNSFKKFTDEIVKRYMQEEEMRSQHQAHLLRLRQRALIEKTNAELSWLKQMKSRLQIRGEDEKMPAILKKHNGIMKKLKEEQDNIKQIKELQRKSSENRLKLLSQHQKVLRWCQNKLELHAFNINGASGDKLDISNSFSNVLLDSFNNVDLDDSNFLEPKLIKVKQRLNYEKYFTEREKKLRSQRKYSENLLNKSECSIGSVTKITKEIHNFDKDFKVGLRNSFTSDEINGKEFSNEIAESSFNQNTRNFLQVNNSSSDFQKNKIINNETDEHREVNSNNFEFYNDSQSSEIDAWNFNEYDRKLSLKRNFLKNIVSLEDKTFSIGKLNKFCQIAIDEYFWPIRDQISFHDNCNNFIDNHLTLSFDEMLFDLIDEKARDLCSSNHRGKKPIFRNIFKFPLNKDDMKNVIIIKLKETFKGLRLEEYAVSSSNIVKSSVKNRSKWYCHKKLDYIDKLLNTEIHQEEVDWCVYENEEIETKLIVSDGILDLLINDTLSVMRNFSF